MVGELQRLARKEEWKDYRFTDLEAEVEVEILQGGLNLRELLSRYRGGLSRERSILRALRRSRDRLLLVEGEPGSGKSIALRHTAVLLAQRASRSRSLRSVIPIYANLKELECDSNTTIDRNVIQSFIVQSLNRINDRDVAEFLTEEFERGLREGTWLFLLDSFDEIPALLSATQADAVVRRYSEAIADFLYGMNRCRGILASRRFRGPASRGWPRLRLQQLSERRQRRLIGRADLPAAASLELLHGLAATSNDLQPLAANPLFLTLLCDHMRNGLPFPANAHAVFEAYVSRRLDRDQAMLTARFQVDVGTVRDFAEHVAFAMLSDSQLSLSADRTAIVRSLAAMGALPSSGADQLFDALEFIKLGRADAEPGIPGHRQFTFAHRRFQEYFATCAALRGHGDVAPQTVLTDARWRETGVVMLQLQDRGSIRPLLIAADEMVRRYVVESTAELAQSAAKDFPWPAGSLHVLGLLQDGLSNRTADGPEELERLIDGIESLIALAQQRGSPADRAQVLEVSGLLRRPKLEQVLTAAFESGSQWLSEIAYRQAGRLVTIPPVIGRGIRQALLSMFDSGRLGDEELATQAFVGRLPIGRGGTNFPLIANLLFHMVTLDATLCVIFVVAIQVWAAILKVWTLLILTEVGALAVVVVSLDRIVRPWLPRGELVRLGLITEVRVALLWVALVAATNTAHVRPLPTTVNLIVACVVGGLYPAVRISIGYARMAFRLWWPFALVWPITIMPPILATIMRMGWRSLVRYAVVVVASCSVMAIVLILVNYLLDRYPLLSQILAVGLGAVLAVLLAVGIGSRVIKGIGDWLAIRRTFGTVQGTITAGQMWLAVDGLKVRYFRLRVLRNVREARRVEPSLDSLGVLTELCFSRAGVYGREGGASTGPAKRDTQVDPDETDELFRIREQVRREIVT